MAGGGILPYPVINAYERLITALENASAQANVGNMFWSEPLISRFSRDPRNDDLVLFEAFFHLAEWPARGQQISIVIRAREAISRATTKLVYSSVHLAYYDVDPESFTSRHLHSVHFDYDGEKDYHPVFHVQLCKDEVPLPPGYAEKLGFTYQNEVSTVTCFGRARIPTTDMTLASVLLCLAADHFDKRPLFIEFLEAVRTLQEGMPLPDFESTKQSIARSPGDLRSSHWFAHMRGR